ncbi:YdeI/OmpD-associated family protein [Sporolactobacillus pectinivorans]|uniref:YdeI/OmpD-associated family protein n=1 Tax=Sporolactobacillus pectinivorans TaxID=1591408 RepID=UPI000C25A8FA|nr:YdeI/OmpD-associated family protein [Sporolactobacillus pectinivorans]
MPNSSLIEKLKLDRYKKVAIMNLPKSEMDCFNNLAEYDQVLKTDRYDLIFAFVFSLNELKEMVRETISHDRLQKNGYLYIAYPKKGNKIYPDSIHRDELFPNLNVNSDGYVGKSDIKFARMISLDEVFTVIGLKEAGFRKGKSNSTSNQSADDYVSYIPQIELYLSGKTAAAFYKNLAPGYQKDWARYVFSAKHETTREKRLSEMEIILDKGFKSKDLYRRSL